MDDYYVYIHRKQTNHEVFYVGKGKGARQIVKSHRSKFWKAIVNKHGYYSTIVLSGLDEETALCIEQFLISYYGRRFDGSGCLVNLTNGGDGTSGYKHTIDAIEAIRKHRIGKKLSMESRQKLSNSTRGRQFSEKAKIANIERTIRPIMRDDGVRYPSIKAAVEALEKELNKQINQSNISSAARGVTKTAYGFKWTYLPKE